MSPPDTPRSHQRTKRGISHKIRDKFSHLSSRQRIASVAGSGVVVVAVVVLLVTVVFASSSAGKNGRPTSHSTTTISAAPHHHLKLDSHVCPLTGQRAPGGQVPQRPAIGIKIGNDPAARPQTGLPDADIVYEEMAEGGITRYLAIYQCHEAPVIGPVRSIRWDDWHILAAYGHPILAYSGGIGIWEAAAASYKWLYNADASYYPMANAYYRTSDRSPPENLYTSTAALWKLDPSMHTPPPPQFHYRPAPPKTSQAATGVTIVGFSESQNVTWTWNAHAGAWERFQGGQPDTDSSGAQLHATNVVIEMVHTQPEPCCETADIPGVESITKGTGVAYVFRNGKVERGTWTTPLYSDVMQLRLANGDLMTLHPGNTWVDVVPTTYAVQVQS